MEHLLTAENLLALLTLTGLEIVLGIDNIIFIAILTAKLPIHQQEKARKIGLLLAMGMRIILLLGISWVMSLSKPLFTIDLRQIAEALKYHHDFTGRDLVLLGGGLFLIGKATHEIHVKLEEAGRREEEKARAAMATFAGVLVQVMVLDIVFSLDSVITAVGMAKEIAVMIAAVVISIAVMMVFAGRISRFVESHPTLKILALAFLVLVGVVLVADGIGGHIEKGYIYFAMAFSLGVEMVNLRITARRRALAPESVAPQPH